MMMVMAVMAVAMMAVVVHATSKGKEANICNLLAEAEEAVVEGLASSYSLLTQREPQNQVKVGDDCNDHNDFNDGNDDDDDDKNGDDGDADAYADDDDRRNRKIR